MIKNGLLSVMGAGIIVFLIGLYFCAVRAGIPYQDPTPEMSLVWSANYLAGTLCIKCGMAVFAAGLLVRLVSRAMRKKT